MSIETETLHPCLPHSCTQVIYHAARRWISTAGPAEESIKADGCDIPLGRAGEFHQHQSEGPGPGEIKRISDKRVPVYYTASPNKIWHLLDLSIQNNYGRTVLHYLVFNRDKHNIRLFLNILGRLQCSL